MGMIDICCCVLHYLICFVSCVSFPLLPRYFVLSDLFCTTLFHSILFDFIFFILFVIFVIFVIFLGHAKGIACVS